VIPGSTYHTNDYTVGLQTTRSSPFVKESFIKLLRSRYYLFATTLIAIVLLAMGFASLVGYSTRAARVMSSRNNLKQVVLGITNYTAQHGQLPRHALHDATGNPVHSWRTLVTPYLVGVDQLYRWDQPWDGPYNIRLARGLAIQVDAPPLDESGQRAFKTMGPYDGPVDYAWPFRTAETVGQSDFRAHFFAIVGDETAWPRSRAIDFDDIADGVANTIILAESHTLDAFWSQPVDLNFDQMTFIVNDSVGPGIGSPRELGPLVAFTDGAIFHLNPNVSPELVRALLTANGGETIDRSQLVREGWLR
jgi:type II secretory pathway pseudopilin PulG